MMIKYLFLSLLYEFLDTCPYRIITLDLQCLRTNE
jgi:hypothetical protein